MDLRTAIGTTAVQIHKVKRAGDGGAVIARGVSWWESERSERGHSPSCNGLFALIPFYCLQRSERGDDYSEAKIISEKAC